jgi:hypothetical protein
LAKSIILISGTIAPVDVGWLHDRRPVGDPILEPLVARGSTHAVLLAESSVVFDNVRLEQ